MGPGTTVNAARAATARTALRAWGDALGGAVDDLGGTLRGNSPKAIAEGVADLTPVPRRSVHAAGWELREALLWRNDDRCIQRSAFAAMSVVEREAGTLRGAIGELATTDARRAAIAVNYTPNFASSMGRARLHTAPVMRADDGELLVIDHLFTDAEDGVLTLAEWMRRSGARAETTRIVDVLHQPPLSMRGSSGIPVPARPHSGEEWRAFADHLSASWDLAADRGLAQHQVIRAR